MASRCAPPRSIWPKANFTDRDWRHRRAHFEKNGTELFHYRIDLVGFSRTRADGPATLQSRSTAARKDMTAAEP